MAVWKPDVPARSCALLEPVQFIKPHGLARPSAESTAEGLHSLMDANIDLTLSDSEDEVCPQPPSITAHGATVQGEGVHASIDRQHAV